MGETCGVKLVHPDFVTPSEEKCRICKAIDVKERKLAKERQNIARWRKEGSRFPASIEKAENEVDTLTESIRALQTNRPINKMGLQGGRPDAMHTGEPATCL